MRRFRWAVLVALVPLFAVGCADGDPAAPELSPDQALAAAADVSWGTPETVLYDDTWWVPCLGEELHFTGTVWYEYHSVLNANREIWTFKWGMNQDMQAVGTTSGIWRVDPSLLNGIVQHNTYVGAPGEPFQVEAWGNPRWKFVNEATGQTLSNPIRVKFIRNAAGEIKVGTWVEPCRLK